MANRRGTAAGDRHDKAADSVQVPGVHRTVLWKWCEEQVMNPNNGYPVNCYGALEYEHEEYAAWEAEVEAVTDKLFEERVGLAEPIDAWWYWLPLPLPPPLDVMNSRAGDGPRHARVTADRVWLMAPVETRWPGRLVREPQLGTGD
jgi:hypothetical protein